MNFWSRIKSAEQITIRYARMTAQRVRMVRRSLWQEVPHQHSSLRILLKRRGCLCLRRRKCRAAQAWPSGRVRCWGVRSMGAMAMRRLARSASKAVRLRPCLPTRITYNKWSPSAIWKSQAREPLTTITRSSLVVRFPSKWTKRSGKARYQSIRKISLEIKSAKRTAIST